MAHIPDLTRLRLEAELSVNQLARKASVNSETIRRAANGYNVQETKARAILRALNETPEHDGRLDTNCIEDGGRSGRFLGKTDKRAQKAVQTIIDSGAMPPPDPEE